MRGPCISCASLPHCRKATPEMVMLLEGCGVFENVEDSVLNGRVRAVDLFGPEVVIKTKQKPGQIIDMDIIGSRKHLRMVAVLSGAVSQGKSFPMKAQALVDAISAMTNDNGEQLYSGVAEMDDAALQALAADLGGGAKKKPAAPAAEESVEEAPAKEAAPPKKPRRTRRTKAEMLAAAAKEASDSAEEPVEAEAKAPGRRPRRKKKADAAAATPPPTEPNALMVDMLQTIGTMLDKAAASAAARDEEITALQGEVSNLTKKLRTIEEYLCWMYNGEQDPGNEITSLEGTSWV
jgi:hypothetical protein